MTTASIILTLFGKIARFSRLERARRLNHRFLCPNCLHFGGFDFACGECWAEIPGYDSGYKTQTCPRCRRSLLSADGDGVRAYCKQCKGNFDRAIYHQREVRVLATLRPTDSKSLYRAISGQEYQPQGGKGYVYDDGARLAYVLNLSDFTDKAHSLSPTHALWKVQSIWLDALASNPKELALEWAETADRSIAQARLTEANRQAITVCVHQAEVNPVVKPALGTHFGKVRYGVAAPYFLFERAQAKAVAVRKIVQDSPVPALITALNDSDRRGSNNVRNNAAAALVKIGKPAVPALCAALKDGHWKMRQSAAMVLGQIGDESALPALCEALKDSKDYVRNSAAEALVKIGKPAAPALCEALKDSKDYVRQEAAEALVRIGKSVVPALCAALKVSNEYVPRNAAEALGKIGDNSAVPALCEALKDSNADVRWKAAEALGQIGEKSAVPVLCEALKDSKVYVCNSVAEALVKIGDTSAVPALCAALKDNDECLRLNAAGALGKIGDKSVTPVLCEALRDSNTDVRWKAAEALVKIGDTSAVPALCVALKDIHLFVRGNAAEALGRIGEKSAVPALRAALRDRDEYVRRKAAEALVEIGGNSAVPVFCKALKDSKDYVCNSAIEALVKIGEPAVPALCESLKDSKLGVCWKAAEALGKIGDKSAVPALNTADSVHHTNIINCPICDALRRLGAK